MLACTFMLILVAIPFIGKSFNGARRWLPIPGIQIQPSEFMKPVIAMYFATQIEQGKSDLRTLKGNMPYLGWIAVITALMLAEPHSYKISSHIRRPCGDQRDQNKKNTVRVGLPKITHTHQTAERQCRQDTHS